MDDEIELSLTCWIPGLENANAFTIYVPRSKTVDHLKDAIKKKKEPILNHVAADQLEIWKVGDFVWRVAAPERLREAEADGFMTDEILLYCSILGPDVGHAFPVRILCSRTVGDLKDAIKEKKGNAQPHRRRST
jgi:hypothetical protein